MASRAGAGAGAAWCRVCQASARSAASSTPCQQRPSQARAPSRIGRIENKKNKANHRALTRNGMAAAAAATPPPLASTNTHLQQPDQLGHRRWRLGPAAASPRLVRQRGNCSPQHLGALPPPAKWLSTPLLTSTCITRTSRTHRSIYTHHTPLAR